MFQNPKITLSPDAGMDGGSLGPRPAYKTITVDVPAQEMSVVYGKATLVLNHAAGKGEFVVPDDVPFAVSNEVLNEFAKGLGGSLDLSKVKLGNFGDQLRSEVETAKMSFSAVSRALYNSLVPEGKLPTKAGVVMLAEQVTPRASPLSMISVSMFRPTISQQLAQPDPHFKVEGSEETGAPSISYESKKNPLRMDMVLAREGILKDTDWFQISSAVDGLLDSILQLDNDYQFEVSPSGLLTAAKDVDAIAKQTAHAVGLLFRYLLIGEEGFPGAIVNSEKNTLEISIPEFNSKCFIVCQLAPYSTSEHMADGSEFFKALKDQSPGIKIHVEVPEIDSKSEVCFKITVGHHPAIFCVVPSDAEKMFTTLVLNLADEKASNQSFGMTKCS